MNDVAATPASEKVLQFHDAKQQAIDVFEQKYLTDLLAQAGENLSEAARIAGIDRTTLYRLIDRHALTRAPANSFSTSR